MSQETHTSEFFSKIRGISNYQQNVRWCSPGKLLRVVREPNNTGDPNAIRLDVDGGLVKKKPRTVGYLSQHLAEQYGPLMDHGLELTIIVSNITGKNPRGVNIVVSTEDEEFYKARARLNRSKKEEQERQIDQARQLAQQEEQKAAEKAQRSEQRKEAVKRAAKSSVVKSRGFLRRVNKFLDPNLDDKPGDD